MIHKLFFIAGLTLMIVALMMHHKGGYFFKHCAHHRMISKKKSDFIMKRLSKKLDLNDLQKSRLKEIHHDLLTKHDSLVMDRGVLFGRFITEIENESLDQDKLNAIFLEKLKKVEAMHPFVVSKIAEFHETLTSEQKLKLTSLMRKHYQRAQTRKI